MACPMPILQISFVIHIPPTQKVIHTALLHTITFSYIAVIVCISSPIIACEQMTLVCPFCCRFLCNPSKRLSTLQCCITLVLYISLFFHFPSDPFIAQSKRLPKLLHNITCSYIAHFVSFSPFFFFNNFTFIHLSPDYKFSWQQVNHFEMFSA